jgi:hypothetical protein
LAFDAVRGTLIRFPPKLMADMRVFGDTVKPLGAYVFFVTAASGRRHNTAT